MIKEKTGEVIVDAFGVVRPHTDEALKCDAHLITQYDYKLNKDKGVFEVQEVDPIDLTEIIQSNKDNCGLNLALLNIARGTSPDKFADDGQHGGDFSGTTNINVAYQESLNNKAVAEKLAKELGIDNYQDFTDPDKVIEFYKMKQAAIAKPAESAGDGGAQ